MAVKAGNSAKSGRKVFISFLGTTGYTVCNYYFDSVEDREMHVRHVQEAIVRHECKGWTENDRILIFLTKDAKDNNWEDGKFGEHEEDSKTVPPIIAGKEKWGLRHQLIKAARGIGNDEDESTAIDKKVFPESIITPVSLDCEGFSEAEIWKIFGCINDNVQENDEVYFDFTSGFRSLPMLGIVLLTYLKNSKNITIGEIYYGAFEKMGTSRDVKKMPVNERNAPVLRLKSFSDIMDFSNAANVFVKFGNGRLLYEHITNWANENRKKKIKSEFTKKIQTLGNTLKMLTDNLQTCRGGEICYVGNQIDGGIFKQLADWFNDYESSSFQEGEFKALQPLLKNIQEKYEAFRTDNSFENGLIAARWCFDNQMYQQSITFLQESLVTYYTEKVGLHPEIEEERTIVEFKLKSLIEKKDDKSLDSEVSPKWIDNFESMNQKRKESFAKSVENGRPVPEIVLAKYDYDGERGECIKSKINEIPESVQQLYQKITELRNDMNHAGFLKYVEVVSGKESRKASGVINSLSNFFEKLDKNNPMTFIEKIESDVNEKEVC